MHFLLSYTNAVMFPRPRSREGQNDCIIARSFFKIEKNLRGRMKREFCSSASATKNNTIAWLEAMMAGNVSREGEKRAFNGTVSVSQTHLTRRRSLIKAKLTTTSTWMFLMKKTKVYLRYSGPWPNYFQRRTVRRQNCRVWKFAHKVQIELNPWCLVPTFENESK